MSLAAGSKLGPYEIVSLVGAGGMGEVYRARDVRLDRDVAIKILPAAVGADQDRLRRFENEARAVAALNHPNILTIFEIELHDGSPYLVTELLEGETLQQRLREGPIPVRKALEIAVQSARGVAAAHEKGIVHRDLKPANIFLTADGRVKILDFGLAKLTQPDAAPGTGIEGQTATVTRAMPSAPVTEEGVVLGTAGYMSPEQVRGKPADARSDIFALGTILYEMLSGERAFQRDSSADTMAAILKEDPPELSGEGKKIPPGVDRVVRHALEKNPSERFQSARDFAFDLESLSGTSGSSTSASGANAAIAAAAPAETGARFKLLAALASLALLAAGALGAWFYARATLHSTPPSFHRLTFRRGYMLNARFAPDGQTVYYWAGWDGNPTDVYEQRVSSPEARSLGLPPDSAVAAVSRTGELAILLHASVYGAFQMSGTLAEIAESGSAPREIASGIAFADWSPDGKQLAVVRPTEKSQTLEFPIGKVLYRTPSWIGDVRVAPDGKHLAFVDHNLVNDDQGSIAIVDLAGKKTTLTPTYSSARGLAWSPTGDEILFSATPNGNARALFAATLSGHVRPVAAIPGTMNLFDVSKDGRVLFSESDERIELAVTSAKDPNLRAAGWLDWSLVQDISRDGNTILFGESGEGAGANYGVYVRKTDGSPAVRLGDGSAVSFSPDGQWVAAYPMNADDGIELLPTGAGEPRKLPTTGGAGHAIGWTSDSKSILYSQFDPKNNSRVYRLGIDGGSPQPLTPEGQDFRLTHDSVSPDGQSFIAYRLGDLAPFVFPISGGTARLIPEFVKGDIVIRWSADGKSIFTAFRSAGAAGAILSKVDLASGKRTLVKTLVPTDRAGFQLIDTGSITPDGQTIAFSYTRILSTLYLMDPVK